MTIFALRKMEDLLTDRPGVTVTGGAARANKFVKVWFQVTFRLGYVSLR